MIYILRSCINPNGRQGKPGSIPSLKPSILHPPWEIIPYREGLEISKLTFHAVEEYTTVNDAADSVEAQFRKTLEQVDKIE